MRKLFATIAAIALTILTLTVIVAAGFIPTGGIDTTFEAQLSGAQVPTGSAMDGQVIAKFDRAFSEVGFKLEVGNNTGEITAAHFHCARAGEDGSIVVSLFMGSFMAPSGVLAEGVRTNADVIPIAAGTCGQEVNNIASLAAAMMEGRIYTNAHTAAFPGGEIRGQHFGH